MRCFQMSHMCDICRLRGGTLYELTKLSDRQLRAAIADGAINPKMQRKDVAMLRGGGRLERGEFQACMDCGRLRPTALSKARPRAA
jgi:hypothetical protein